MLSRNATKIKDFKERRRRENNFFRKGNGSYQKRRSDIEPWRAKENGRLDSSRKGVRLKGKSLMGLPVNKKKAYPD